MIKKQPLLFHVMLKQGIHIASHWLPAIMKLYKTIKILSGWLVF